MKWDRECINKTTSFVVNKAKVKRLTDIGIDLTKLLNLPWAEISINDNSIPDEVLNNVLDEYRTPGSHHYMRSVYDSNDILLICRRIMIENKDYIPRGDMDDENEKCREEYKLAKCIFHTVMQVFENVVEGKYSTLITFGEDVIENSFESKIVNVLIDMGLGITKLRNHIIRVEWD